jgi:hypothetical protein
MDDIIVFMMARAAYDELALDVAAQLSFAGQELNEKKLRYDELTPTLEAVEASGFIDDVAGPWFDDPYDAFVTRALCHGGDGLARALGQLKARRDARAIKTIVAEPWVVCRFPRQVASYFAAVRAEVEDWDWFLEFALRETDDENAMAQLWLVRLVRGSRIGPAEGQRLFDKGMALNPRQYGPLANELMAAAGRAQGRLATRQQRAVDYAVERRDLNARRALLSTCIQDSPLANVRRGLAHLRLSDPDLEPTLALVDAA